jgi:peptidoglycan hydrolase CwlO-like protein
MATGPIMPYGAAINDAIKRQDKGEMQQLLAQAKDLHQKQGDLGKAIQELEAALKKNY